MNNKSFNSFDELVDAAMAKYPKARRRPVANFSSGYHKMSIEASMNLEMDTQAYGWNSHIVNAIRFVINNQSNIVVKA